MVSRSVCCRAGRSRAPPVSSGRRCSSRAQHRLRREQPDAGGGQLDGQRQPVQATADLGDGRRVLVGEREVGLTAPRPLDEQGHRRVAGASGSARRRLPSVGQRQRRHRELVLAAQLQRRPAGHQHLQARARRQQLGDDRRGGAGLLEVVQQQQQALVRR